MYRGHPRADNFLKYRRFIQDHYNGVAGTLTAVTGFVTGHEALAGRLIRARRVRRGGSERVPRRGVRKRQVSAFPG